MRSENAFFCNRWSKHLDVNCSGDSKSMDTLVTAFSHKSSLRAQAAARVSSFMARAEIPSFPKVFSYHFHEYQSGEGVWCSPSLPQDPWWDTQQQEQDFVEILV
jgi:hypothetical protein